MHRSLTLVRMDVGGGGGAGGADWLPRFRQAAPGQLWLLM